MSLFGKMVRTAVNTVLLPIAVLEDVKDSFEGIERPQSNTSEALKRLKEEAEDN